MHSSRWGLSGEPTSLLDFRHNNFFLWDFLLSYPLSIPKIHCKKLKCDIVYWSDVDIRFTEYRHAQVRFYEIYYYVERKEVSPFQSILVTIIEHGCYNHVLKYSCLSIFEQPKTAKKKTYLNFTVAK